jgi:hypothetical protein
MSKCSFCLWRYFTGLFLIGSLLCLLGTLIQENVHGAELTFVYAVQISAEPQVSPPQITLNWIPDPLGANSYTLYRKAKSDTSWGNGTILSGSTSSYIDTSVAPGMTYEYQIVKSSVIGYTGYGYIYTGINAPLTEERGKLVLIVATNSTVGLSSELARLESDLTGDGWRVLRYDVSSNDAPSSVKSLIKMEYDADPGGVTAVFLFGHVPILQSGNLNYDGHLTRPMPADAYYGEMDNDWPTEPGSSPSFLPSDVELMVGRVDLSNMPGNGAAIPWPSETELLRSYLNKDHNWRHKMISVPRLALMGNRRGDEGGRATASGGYRNFTPFVGSGNIIEANTADTAPPEQRWISMLAANSYLWAYGCGGGQPTAISALGTHDQYNDMWSMDVVGQDAKAVFVMLFGSWFGNWDGPDNVMRSFLATPTMGLASCMSGGPHWFLHHMGLGEPIGFGTRLTMNNDTLYRNQSNDFRRAVFVALMGDPTLRMDPVAPPSNFFATQNNTFVNLNWNASSDSSLVGYHVYRSVSSSAPFSRLTQSLMQGTTFSDGSVSPGSYTYMVRAIKLETTPSGSYYNPSQGVFSTLTVIPIPVLRASLGSNGVTLSWNSVAGVSYRVQVRNAGQEAIWSELSGSIIATGASTTWVDSNTTEIGRSYRVVSP